MTNNPIPILAAVALVWLVSSGADAGVYSHDGMTLASVAKSVVDFCIPCPWR